MNDANRREIRERNERMTGAIDPEAFEKVIRDNMSPETVATIIAFLQPALSAKTSNPDAADALIGVQWFHDTLMAMLGVEEADRLFKELCL